MYYLHFEAKQMDLQLDSLCYLTADLNYVFIGNFFSATG